ncbi:MAG: SUMF1/EgtB/PvdO family nonheme iron enzyme, partial [Lentisphaeria bacterium]|nr:SUMF1/EgtB/PvdO family nonheme iron enzyme [Lentisphaeria bacterium]
MKKVSAAGARFRMGEGYNSKATPHFVSFKKDYYIGQYEVTQAQWDALMEANPSGFKGDDLPVEKVLWDEVMEFCKKLNESGKAPAGWIFTLPT